jgi:hypothetical protein
LKKRLKINLMASMSRPDSLALFSVFTCIVHSEPAPEDILYLSTVYHERNGNYGFDEAKGAAKLYKR